MEVTAANIGMPTTVVHLATYQLTNFDSSAHWPVVRTVFHVLIAQFAGMLQDLAVNKIIEQ